MIWGQFGFGFDPLEFFGVLDAFFGAIVNALIAAFNFLFHILIAIAQFIWNGLIAIVNFLGHAFTILGRFFQHLWDKILKPIFTTLVKDYQKLRAFLQRVLGPYLKFIQTIQVWITKHILPIIKLAIAIIQRVRIILEIFRLLGFKWAAKLDADLRKVQDFLTTALQDIVVGLNTLTTIMEVIIDPAMLLRKNVLGGTLFKYLGALKRAVGFGGNRALDPDEAQSQQDNAAMLQGNAPFAKRNSDGSVSYSPAFQAISNSMDQAGKVYLVPVTKP
jgi:hypothetical protein